MKKFLFPVIFFLFLFIPAYLKSQGNHFIYLQTEGKQPFYAKLDKTVLSSSASGYLIIPKLKDGAYNITIGFPKIENAEQNYICTVQNKDAGYLIKNFGDKGWGLFNLQTLEVEMAGINQEKGDITKVEKADDFSSMLSDAVNDPTIKQTVAVKDESGKITKDVKIENGSGKQEGADQEKVETAQRPFEKGITKIKETADNTGVEMIYLDMSGEKPDTIKVFIPAEKINKGNKSIKPKKPVKPDEKIMSDNNSQENKQKPQETQETSAEIVIKADTVTVETKQDTGIVTDRVVAKDPGTKFLPIDLAVQAKKADEKKDSGLIEMPVTNNDKIAEPVTGQQFPKTLMINSDCKNNATEDDFLKLRKKMAAVEIEEQMIIVAKKYFKTKCFTTDQIKNLSSLFLKDPGKYNFFDLAYQYVSDSHNFSTLQNQLTEAYYINRFKVMIRQQ